MTRVTYRVSRSARLTTRNREAPFRDTIKVLGISALLALSACAADNNGVTRLAARLAMEGGEDLPQDYREGYVACGVKALSNQPPERIDAALRAPDAPAIWSILGNDALNRYVQACRETDLKRGPPR